MTIRKPSSDNKVHIGVQGENLAYTVAVQISTFVKNFDIGEFKALYCRPSETDVYPVEITTDENYIYWSPNIFDTQIAGNAKFELQYFVHETLVKSKVYTCIIDEGLMLQPNAPVVLQPWVDNIDNAIIDARDASRKQPYIDEETKNWMLYDYDLQEYVDSGVYAIGPQGDPYTTSEEFQTLIADTVEIANDIKDKCEFAAAHYPQINSIGNWEVWKDGWVDTGIHAKGDTGNSAVAIGPTMPTDENITVWINTSGDADDYAGRVIADVILDGATCQTHGVAEIPKATSTRGGYVRVNDDKGISIEQDGTICVNSATEQDILDAENVFKPIVPATLGYAVKQAFSGENYQEWDDQSKASARNKFGFGRHKKIFELSWDASNYQTRYEIDCTTGCRAYYLSIVASRQPINSVQSQFGFKFDDNSVALCQKYVSPGDYQFISHVGIINDWITMNNTRIGQNTTPSTCTQWVNGISDKEVSKIILQFESGNYLPTGSTVCVYEV